MDVVKLARKLAPLRPREVEHWLRVRDTADAGLRALIDQQIMTTAYQVLGDFRGKILLSLPPPPRARGPIHLGTTLYEKPKWSVGISTAELLQNLAMYGRSGAGKTNVAFHLLEQLAARKIPFLFLDWKRTARHLLPRIKGRVNVYTPGRSLAPLAFNPFIPPPGLEAKVYISQVVDVLADAYTLGDGARSVLQRAILACYRPSGSVPVVADVLAEVEKLRTEGRARGWKISAVRALESLDFADLTTQDPVSQERLAQSLLHENTIIELDALSQNAKKFLIPLLGLWVYYVQLASSIREKLQLVIFVEEAHHVFYRSAHRAKESLMEMLVRQCREVGISMVVIDQHPHLLSPAVLGNTYTSICLNLKDPTDINRAAALSLVNEQDKPYFSMLPVGQGIVKLQDRWRQPFVVQFPLVGVRKGSVDDAALRRYWQHGRTGSGARAVGGREFDGVSQVSMGDEALDDMALRFLQDVVEHSDDGVKVRYRRLGIGAGRGTRLKEALIHEGWLESQVVEVGQSRKVLLRLTPSARNALGLGAGVTGRGSLAHEYWKRYYARRFAEQGYQVVLEAPRHGGRVDVLASKGRERIGIEIETGQSEIVQNVKNCLWSGFTKILVVATNEAALQKVEEQLAKAGLLIPQRVTVVLRSNVGRWHTSDFTSVHHYTDCSGTP